MLKLYRPAMKSAFLMSLVVARKPAVFTTLPGPNRMPSRLMMKTRPLAVSVPMISDGPEPAGHAVERDRRGARLIEAHALVGADVERVPVDDRAAGRLVDDHRRAALALDGGGAADHRRRLRARPLPARPQAPAAPWRRATRCACEAGLSRYSEAPSRMQDRQRRRCSGRFLSFMPVFQ